MECDGDALFIDEIRDERIATQEAVQTMARKRPIQGYGKVLHLRQRCEGGDQP